ncbi:MAG: hypothetical protein RSB75_04310 [Anaerovoracaceae bacterium]
MYELKKWQDHVTQFQDRFREVENSDGTFTHEPVEGEVIQQGTPQSAKNFNRMEEGILAANELGALMLLALNHNRQAIKSLSGEIVTSTLTNSHQYPFNNSKKTLSLGTKRDNLNYTVHVEAASVNGGAVGDIIISDKQLNGFKIEFTGSAKSVDVKCYVKGGYFNG